MADNDTVLQSAVTASLPAGTKLTSRVAGYAGDSDTRLFPTALVNLSGSDDAKTATDVLIPSEAQVQALIDLITAGTAKVTISHGKTIKSVSGSFASDTDLVAAVATKRIKVIAFGFHTFGTSATTVALKSDGTGGTQLWAVPVQAGTAAVNGAHLAVEAPSWIFATAAGKKLTADTNTSDTVIYNISYFDDDAT